MKVIDSFLQMNRRDSYKPFALSILLVTLLFMLSTSHASHKEFTYESLKTIEDQYKNQPFILAMWSIDCPPCLKELALFEDTLKNYDNVNIVIISVDGLSNTKQINSILNNFNLSQAESWIFAEDFIEKLRFGIDPEWTAELPRTYLYDSTHNRKSISGQINKNELTDWINFFVVNPE